MRKGYITMIICAFIGLMIGFWHCEGNPKLQVSYSTDIDPIFSTKDCKICHTADISPHLDLTTYQGLMRGSDNGPVVVPGDPDNSLLFLKVAYDNPPIGLRMPMGRAPLTQSQIRLLEDWINQGAKNN
jgi:hypothetical protein